MILVDSHCHFDLLNEDAVPDDAEVIKRAQETGVQYFLNVCVKLSRLKEVLKPAETFSFVFASVGLHPNDDSEEAEINQLIELADHPRIVAIGETGLDYFRSSGDLDWQRERFKKHIAAAKSANKPLIIHTRDAIDDTLRIMHEEDASKVRGVMHCFTENWQSAQKALEMGFYISFSGIVTFKNAQTIQEVALNIPLDRMLIETDAPYLAPMPMRGKPNEPAYVRHTAEFIAKMRGIPVEQLAEQTTDNFFTLFNEAKRIDV